MGQYSAVFTTTDTREEAQKLAGALVEHKLAACAQINEIESVYTWDGAVQHDAEFRILFKVKASQYDAVEKMIVDMHSYELPAIYALEFARVYQPFGNWIDETGSG
jgi:periplasmic divalent cation tolerance protein